MFSLHGKTFVVNTKRLARSVDNETMAWYHCIVFKTKAGRVLLHRPGRDGETEQPAPSHLRTGINRRFQGEWEMSHTPRQRINLTSGAIEYRSKLLTGYQAESFARCLRANAERFR